MTKFKEKLDEINFSFDEAHWKQLEKRLDEKKKRRFFFYFILTAGLALCVLVTYAWLQASVSDIAISHHLSSQPADTIPPRARKPYEDIAAAKTVDRQQDTNPGMSAVAATNAAGSKVTLYKGPAHATSGIRTYIRPVAADTSFSKGTGQDGQKLPANTRTGSHTGIAGEVQVEKPAHMLVSASEDFLGDELLRLDTMGWGNFNPHYQPADTSKKPGLPTKLRTFRRHELAAGRGSILKPRADMLESFHAQSYHLAYCRFLNRRVYMGLGLSLEYYTYSIPEYKIIYRDALIRDQFMAYNGASLKYTQLVPALSAGYKMNITPRIHMAFEAGLQCLAVVSSKKDIGVTYTVEYKYFDTMSRQADIYRVKNDRQEQKNLGLNPLPAWQLTYFGKASLGIDVWKKRVGVRTSLEYRRLPVMGFVPHSAKHLLIPGFSVYWRF